MRLRAPALKHRASLIPLLSQSLTRLPGVHSAAINPLTGSILLHFDPQRVALDDLVSRIARRLTDSGVTEQPVHRSQPPDPRPQSPARSDRKPQKPGDQKARRGRRKADHASDAPLSESQLADAQRWATRSVGESFVQLDSSPTGLSPAEATRRRARTGPNRLPEVDRRSSAQILRDQLISVPTVMLLGAVGLSLATGGLFDAAVITAVLAMNGAIGFGTERYAEGAIRALQRLGSPRATVLRSGHTQDIAGADVVDGDVVRLRPGDLVPADGRIIESHALSVEEASLTGESVPVPKTRDPISAPATLDACRNLVFMGTAVATGHGRALITATGPRTQIGRITALVGSETTPRTRLQEGLDDLAKRLGVDTLAACAFLFGLGVLFGIPALSMLQTAVALAISAVPEGLPAIATTALAVGMARMLRRQVVIRRLAAVEALGGITVLCVDKTGTLTLNRMQVVEVWVDGGILPFRPSGNWAIGRVPTATPGPHPELSSTLRRLLEVGVLCNEADLEIGSRGLRIRGSSTEGALLLTARNAGIDEEALRDAHPLIDIRHRETGNPLMATLHDAANKQHRLCVKGAPDTVLGVCSQVLMNGSQQPLTPALRRRIRQAHEEMAAAGLRVLGYAEALRESPDVDNLNHGGLTWLGLTGMEDPLRPGVTESISRCRDAGIRTVILTGDHPATAAAVARALDIGQDEEEHVAEASALIGLPPDELRATVERIDVYARVSPEDKLRIVRALQANGEVIAMTGDGVNDGPAMKAADVGIAMGRHGTEVAKEIADMVLLEDDFDQMAVAIEQGRTIYSNIRRSLRYLVASNLSEVIAVGLSLITRVPIPLSAIQMLWMNLISDVLPALALTLEPPAPDTMRQPPRPPEEPLIPPDDWRMMTRDAVTLAASTMAVYRWATRRHGPGLNAQTVAFTAAAMGEILYAITCGSPFVRTPDRSLPRPNALLLGTVGGTLALQALTVFIPPARRLLGLSTLDARDWLTVLTGAALPVALTASRRSSAGERRPEPAALPALVRR